MTARRLLTRGPNALEPPEAQPQTVPVGKRTALKVQEKVAPRRAGIRATCRSCSAATHAKSEGGEPVRYYLGVDWADQTVQPVTAVLQPVEVRSRRPPRVPCSDTRLAGRATVPRESSGISPRRPESDVSPGRIGPGGQATTRAVAKRTLKRRKAPPTEADVGSGGADSVVWEEGEGAGTHRGYGPASPPGVEVTARVEGALTQSREGLVRSPDQVVGQGLLYNQCPGKSGGAARLADRAVVARRSGTT